MHTNILIQQYEEKISLGRCRRRWKDNIRMDLKDSTPLSPKRTTGNDPEPVPAVSIHSK
jgi:hypothetical protein